MDFLELMRKRYTTKHYSDKKVPAEIFDKIMECARLTPTAVNAQPYHFYVAGEEAKQKIREAVKDFNLSRYDSASHVVVVSSLTAMNDEQLKAVLDAECKDGRLVGEKYITAQDSSRRMFSQMHVDRGDYEAWCGKQAYIALASMLYAAESYGVDSTAVEGIYESEVDRILGLKEKGETCQYIVLFGYRAENDSNTVDKRPKSRLPSDRLITRI